MENKVINLEEEYFKKKNKEAYEMLKNREFLKTKEILKEPIEKIDVKLSECKKYCPQNVFEAAIYLNFLEPKAKQEDFWKVNYYDFYLMMAASEYNLENYEESRKFYNKALAVNPASSVARLQLLEMDKLEKRFENFTDDIKAIFDYAYRRADIAKAYRNMGYYLYEIEDYENAIVAYFLSNVYEATELSMKEVKHIGEIANIDLNSKQWLSEELMGSFYDKYKIPLLPSSNLIKLARIMAEDAYSKNALKHALFLYKVVYEMTLEEEVLNKIQELTKMVIK